MSDLQSLLERLKGATGPDREIDRPMMAISYRWERRHIGVTCWDDESGTCCPGGRHLDGVWVDPETDKWRTSAVDGFEFTASKDAAIALAEKVFPGVWWTVGKGRLRAGEPLYGAQLLFGSDGVLGAEEHEHSAALAVCAALLQALIASKSPSEPSA